MTRRERERWVTVEEFPAYAVSDWGRVMNTHTDLIKTPTANQQGIPNVLLMNEHRQFRRGVALLVARHFIPQRKPLFDTPINLDGDRWNNRWDNLEWRPRWFAIAFHKQFHLPIPFGFNAGVRCVETMEVFDTVDDAAKRHGLLVKEIIHSTQTQVPVFPTWQTFAVMQNG